MKVATLDPRGEVVDVAEPPPKPKTALEIAVEHYEASVQEVLLALVAGLGTKGARHISAIGRFIGPAQAALLAVKTLSAADAAASLGEGGLGTLNLSPSYPGMPLGYGVGIGGDVYGETAAEIPIMPGNPSENAGAKMLREFLAGAKQAKEAKAAEDAPSPAFELESLLGAYERARKVKLPDVARQIKARIDAILAPPAPCAPSKDVVGAMPKER